MNADGQQPQKQHKLHTEVVRTGIKNTFVTTVAKSKTISKAEKEHSRHAFAFGRRDEYRDHTPAGPASRSAKTKT